MPELPEVEAYRVAAQAALGRRVAELEVQDPRVLASGTSTTALVERVPGRKLVAVRRRGKLLVLDLPPTRLGLRFGMTGRLLVDGWSPVERLLWASPRLEPRWLRLVVRFEGGGSLGLVDPRLLGRVALDPDEDALGPDALTATPAELARALQGSVALKARLLDQRRIAGIGNLVADELLWRAALAPGRPAGSLEVADRTRLHRILRRTLADLVARGGSHLGDLMPERRPGGRCPRDGTPLVRGRVGGRTTWWCPAHQR
ncbi:DNA-formamidopyrimidine glycosylase family protein [Aciditerrimonas ferrireducens]|uniref:DNA-formamidopyrimidine glycosylase family protein n=1 Tax=Aciditerrimonas ferrireducens TaxID=667306 RepID=A0ABV6C2R1_9ACTN